MPSGVWPGRKEAKTWWRNLRVAAPVRLRLLGPMLAAVLVTGIIQGLAGLRNLGSRMVRWRGFAWPRLRQRHTVAGAAMLLAVPWGLWHLPTFWLDTGLRGFPC